MRNCIECCKSNSGSALILSLIMVSLLALLLMSDMEWLQRHTRLLAHAKQRLDFDLALRHFVLNKQSPYRYIPDIAAFNDVCDGGYCFFGKTYFTLETSDDGYCDDGTIIAPELLWQDSAKYNAYTQSYYRYQWISELLCPDYGQSKLPMVRTTIRVSNDQLLHLAAMSVEVVHDADSVYAWHIRLGL